MDIDTEAWIIATSHQFAWWLRQEAEEMDDFTKVAHFCGECGHIYQWSADDIAWQYEASYFMPCGHLWKFLDKQIASECDVADELVAVILIQGPVTHTDEQPLCWDPECPCKQDIDLLKKQVFEPFFDGLLTAGEARQVMEGKQL